MKMRMMAAAAVAIGGLAATMPQAGAQTSVNLVRNPGAEAGQGGNGNVVAIPHWTKDVGPATVVRYGASGFPTMSTPGPASRGARFFAGGPADADWGTRTISQTIDLSQFAGMIDQGEAGYNVSAFLGGKTNIADSAMVEIMFRGPGGMVGNSVKLGPVSAADRGNQTKLVKRAKSGTIPAGARSAYVQVVFMNANGGAVDAYADNIVLKVTTPDN